MNQKLQNYINKLDLRKLAIFSGGLVLIFVILNLVIFAAFLHRTYPNTYIANLSIGSVNYNSVPNKINSLALLPHSIALQQHGKSTHITPVKLGMEVDYAKIETSAKKRSWLPLVNLFKSHKIPVSIKFNKTTLASKLSELALLDKSDPVNAHIVIQNSRFLLAGSTNGYQLNIAQAASAITHAAAENKTVIMLPLTVIVPKVTSASLQPSLQQLQTQQNIALSFTYNGKTTRPSSATITSWYGLENNNYSPQANKIRSYIAAVGASDGIQVQNMSAAITATMSALQKMSATAVALVAVPPSVCSSSSISQLVLVNITQQHMWACQGPDQVYDSPVTTGAYQETPTGTWHIYAKETNLHLIGPTWNDYVNYWLPFYSAYGFHDASWQTFPFGGPEYTTQGSHGCVHLPTTAMAWLYGWSKIGTTVTITQ